MTRGRRRACNWCRACSRETSKSMGFACVCCDPGHRTPLAATPHCRLLDLYANILELLLRLRQICCHSGLLPRDADVKAFLEKVERLARGAGPQAAAAAQLAEGELLARLREVLEDEEGGNNDCPICLSEFTGRTLPRLCTATAMAHVPSFLGCRAVHHPVRARFLPGLCDCCDPGEPPLPALPARAGAR